MNDLISRQAAIDALAKFVPYAICDESTESYTNGLTDAYNLICQLPSAHPDITDEQAIVHLQASGWMQSHDKQMYEMGLKERLADDSDSYDALLPPAQPEIIRCKECRYADEDGVCQNSVGLVIQDDDDFCSKAERRQDAIN